jgi:serine/threonine protein kinase
MSAAVEGTRERRLGRYTLHGKIASGGMATVHFGRLEGEGGFSRIVAIKRMASHLAEDPDFKAMFLDEARLASRIRHPNVISTIDVGSSEEGLFLVMEYVTGESLASLLRAVAACGGSIPTPIALRVLVDTLFGLHAAHTATDEAGRPLHIVHRDVSPQNILVATDGLARVLDFGIAKAAGSLHTTREGQLKGKFRYMSPEQVSDKKVTARSDVYSASVVLWEALTAKPLFGASNDAAIVARVLEGVISPPSKLSPAIPNALDAIVLKGLARDPELRFPTALAMADALEALGSPAPATARQVGLWVEEVAADVLRRRREQTASIDAAGGSILTAPAPSSSSEPHTHTHTMEGRLAPDVDAEPTLLAPTPLPSRHPGLRWALPAMMLGVGVLVTLGALAFVKTRGTREAAPAQAASAATSTPPVESTALPAEPTPSPPEPPSPSTPAEEAPRAVASEAPTPSVGSKGPVVPSPTLRLGHAKPPVNVSPKTSCSPPYYEDPSGIRRVKPECL